MKRAAVLCCAPLLLAAGPALMPGEWEVRVKPRSLAAAELLPKGLAEETVGRVVVRRHCLDAADVGRRPGQVFLAARPGCRLVRDTSTADRFGVEIACADGRKGSMTGTVTAGAYTAIAEMTLPRGMKLVSDISGRRLAACVKPPPPPPLPAPEEDAPSLDEPA